MTVIRTKGLCKYFKDKKALDDLNLDATFLKNNLPEALDEKIPKNRYGTL
jgi:hypothetical protein